MTLTVRSLTKSYGAADVLRGVDIELRPGAVHALLGPNGAGKSTLIKCLGGVVAPDRGEIRLDGRALLEMTPAAAFDAGIVTIHQHQSLIDTLSVADNIFLGSELPRLRGGGRRGQQRIARELLARIGADIAPETIVATLPIGTRQLVEIAKALRRSALRVLILDEPTAALSDRETQTLFREIAGLRAAGVMTLYTTHRLGEVFRIADDVTVIRDGRVILQGPTRELTPDALIAAVSRTGAAPAAAGAGPAADGGAAVAELEALAGPRFGPVSLSLRAGEILGLFGAVGSGRSSLMETLGGRHRASAGRALVDGRRHAPRSARQAMRRGVFLIPSDRVRQALCPTLSARDNLLLPCLRKLARAGVRRFRREAETFREVAQALDLQPRNPELPVERLSGGNQQKLLIGRVLAQRRDVRVLLVDEPTQGVDVGARAQIYAALAALARDSQCAILLASSEAEEIVRVCRRALVMRNGVIVDELAGARLTEEGLLRSAHQFVGRA
ncbi:MAG: sugar ABC transporter ATP-binding protein [Burkholderiales bacterium]|nr:sugar ABC transporter ATP-binding protein [Burkholderiales bacterium]